MLDSLTRKNPRFVLVIGDEDVVFAPMNMREAAAPVFASSRDAAARKKILDQLTHNPKIPVTILVNGSAQEFRVETLPPLNSLDRGKLVRRRLQQAFPHAYARASRVVDSSHALLASLSQGGAVASWLAVLSPDRVSVGLLPVESAGLVAQLMPDARRGWGMLLAHFHTGGLRQIVTRDGQIIFTRQRQVFDAEDDSKSAVAAVTRFIEDSRGYLARFGLTEAADLLVTLLVGDEFHAAFAAHAKIKNLLVLSPQQSAERLRLHISAAENNQDSDLLFAAWIAQRPRLTLPILPPAIKRQRREARMGRLGLRFAAAVFALALGLTGLEASRVIGLAYQNFRQTRAVADLRNHLIAQEARLAPAGQRLGRLRAALERQRLMTAPEDEPWNAIRQLAQGLDGQARVTSIGWRYDDALRVDLRLNPDKNPANADHETIVRNFRMLAEHLARAMPGYRIDVTRYPFPAMPQETLTNAGAGTGDAADAPTAEIALRRRL